MRCQAEQALSRVLTRTTPSADGRPGLQRYNGPVSESRKLTLRCPGCASHLVLDAATGEVLHHRKAEKEPAGGKGFAELLAGLDKEKAQAEEVFEREVMAHEDRDRLLEEKFRHALERAAKDPDDGPPPSPFDFE